MPRSSTQYACLSCEVSTTCDVSFIGPYLNHPHLNCKCVPYNRHFFLYSSAHTQPFPLLFPVLRWRWFECVVYPSRMDVAADTADDMYTEESIHNHTLTVLDFIAEMHLETSEAQVIARLLHVVDLEHAHRRLLHLRGGPPTEWRSGWSRPTELWCCCCCGCWATDVGRGAKRLPLYASGWKVNVWCDTSLIRCIDKASKIEDNQGLPTQKLTQRCISLRSMTNCRAVLLSDLLSELTLK